MKFSPHMDIYLQPVSLPTGSGLLEGESSPSPHSQTAAQMVAYTLRSAL